MIDPIAESLNMKPLETTPVINCEVVEVVDKTKVEDDFETARSNIADIIEVGKSALDDMAEVARQSQAPRAYEVFSTLMNSVVAANKDLLDLQKKKKDIEGSSSKHNNGAGVTNNNVFVGSTTELLAIMAKNKNGSSN